MCRLRIKKLFILVHNLYQSFPTSSHDIRKVNQRFVPHIVIDDLVGPTNLSDFRL